MPTGKEILVAKQMIWLKTPFQPSFPATVNSVKEGVFWTNLPRSEGQVLLLQKQQEVEIGVSMAKNFYKAKTNMARVGPDQDNAKFYCFTIPDSFTKTQERQFLRAPYANNALFRTGGCVAHTSLINFSAGGVMVFLVPELEKVLNSGQEITIDTNIGGTDFQVPVHFAWKKQFDNMLFAGFKFRDLEPSKQETINNLATKHVGGKIN